MRSCSNKMVCISMELLGYDVNEFGFSRLDYLADLYMYDENVATNPEYAHHVERVLKQELYDMVQSKAITFSEFETLWHELELS